jgi:hypothetical protein
MRGSGGRGRKTGARGAWPTKRRRPSAHNGRRMRGTEPNSLRTVGPRAPSARAERRERRVALHARRAPSGATDPPASRLTAVSHFPHGEDVPGLGGCRLQLAAEFRDVDVHRPARHPGLLTRLPAATPVAWRRPRGGPTARQAGRTPWGGGRRPDRSGEPRGSSGSPRRRRTAPPRVSSPEVRLPGGRSASTRAPDERPDAGEELQGTERLGDVVVRAQAEPADLVLLCAARR